MISSVFTQQSHFVHINICTYGAQLKFISLNSTNDIISKILTPTVCNTSQDKLNANISLIESLERVSLIEGAKTRRSGFGILLDIFQWNIFSSLSFLVILFFFSFSNNLESAYPIQGANILLDCSSWEITVIWDVTKIPFSLSKLVRIMSVRGGDSGPFDHHCSVSHCLWFKALAEFDLVWVSFRSSWDLFEADLG